MKLSRWFFIAILYMVSVPLHAALTFACKWEQLRQGVVERLTKRSSFVLVDFFERPETEEELVNSTSEKEAANEATKYIAGSIIALLLLAWLIAVVTNYKISSSIYGLAVAAQGSLLLAGTDYIESHSDALKPENFHINKRIRRGVGFYLFALGFLLQILALYIEQEEVVINVVTTSQANDAFLITTAVSGLIFLSIYQVMSILAISTTFSLLVLISTLAAMTVFGPATGLATFSGLLILIPIGFLLYISKEFLERVLWAISIILFGKESNNRLLAKDVILILSPCALLFITRGSIPDLFALNYQNPIWFQFYTAAYTHANSAHLFGNIVGYILATLPLYALYTYQDRRREFFRAFALIFLAVPVIANVASYLTWGIVVDAPIGYGRGLSGVVAAFGGLLLMRILGAYEKEFPEENAMGATSLFGITLFATWAATFDGLIRILMVGLLTVLLAVVAYASWNGSVAVSGLVEWGQENRRLAVILLFGTFAALYLVVATFPASVQNQDGFTNLVGHGAGFFTGMLVAQAGSR